MSPCIVDVERMMLKSVTGLYSHLVAKPIDLNMHQPNIMEECFELDLGACCLVHHMVAPQIMHQKLCCLLPANYEE